MAPKKKTDTVDCEILRDFWDEDGVRHKAGTVEAFTMDAALDGLEAGALKRVKAK